HCQWGYRNGQVVGTPAACQAWLSRRSLFLAAFAIQARVQKAMRRGYQVWIPYASLYEIWTADTLLRPNAPVLLPEKYDMETVGLYLHEPAERISQVFTDLDIYTDGNL